MLAGVEASIDVTTLFPGFARSGGCPVEGGRSCRERPPVWCERCERCEVVAAQAADGERGGQPMGGDRPLRLAGERDWLLARIAAKPDLTLRAVQGELADRGIRVSLKAIWNFFRVERLTFKKKPARRRTGSPRRGAPASAVEEVSGPD